MSITPLANIANFLRGSAAVMCGKALPFREALPILRAMPATSFTPIDAGGVAPNLNSTTTERQSLSAHHCGRAAISQAITLLVLLMCCVAVQAAEPVEAETARLSFRVAPLATIGDAAAQTRQGLRSFGKAVVHLRAFVTGHEHIAAVRATVEREFKNRPALTIIVIAALPQSGALVALEAVVTEPRVVNPHGLAFVSGMAVTDNNPAAAPLPLAEKSLRDLAAAHQAANVVASDIMRMTCLMSSLSAVAMIRQRAQAAFPNAGLSFVQLQRNTARAVVECETVARARQAEREPLRLVMSDALAKSPNYSHATVVSAPRIVFSGLQLTTNESEAASRATYTQLAAALKRAGASIKHVAMSSIYPTTQTALDAVRNTRFEFYDRAHPPASTMLLFEGLPNQAKAFGLDVISIKVK